MDDLQKKIVVLEKIAREFNREDILWAVGGSLLLYFKGKVELFHDIDIMIDEKDVEKCKNILLNMGSIDAGNPDPQYKTKVFMEFIVDGVEIDVMAGFVIVEHDVEHDCALKSEQIVEYIAVGGERVPLQELLLWRLYYEWMGRRTKVELIDSSLQSGSETY